ncbi:MAG TPA: macro domain-containing protein [Gemmata sp.]
MVSALKITAADRPNRQKTLPRPQESRRTKIYCATWAALLAVQAFNSAHGHPIETVAFPAMGTGFGGVPFDEAARQMAAAWRSYLEPPHRLDWDFVVERHRAISYDGSRQVVR